MAPKREKLLRVGELAKAVGKTVRAIHLYEELGLLRPVSRSGGGFRLFHPGTVARIAWIGKLQAIGFSLPDIQGFLHDFETAQNGPSASSRVRSVFEDKLLQIRAQMQQLRVVENDLVEAIDYLESCQTCEPAHLTEECGECGHHGHERGVAPELFAGLSHGAAPPRGFDVALDDLRHGARGAIDTRPIDVNADLDADADNAEKTN